MAYAIFTLSILLLNLVLDMGGAYNSIPFLRLLDDVEWAFLLPVFLFIFILRRVDHTTKNNKKTLLLFVPFGYSAILNITHDLDVVLGLFKFPNFANRIIDILDLIEYLVVLTFIPVMLFYSYRLLKYSKNLPEKRWLNILWSIFAALLFSWDATLFIGLVFQYDISYVLKMLALFGTFLIHWTAYIGIYKYNLANNKDGIQKFLKNELLVPNNNLLIDNDEKEENKESITSDNLYFQKLDLLCKDHHIYTDCTLNREKIAEKLGISAGYLSQIVNTTTGDNFANYINQYRIEAVKEMILNSEYENYNLLTMGLESGFTSKTTFYKAFKKATGQTPNEYRNSNK
ncbi:helix-turn-helix domain-containing protein [Flavobacterium circumlabens]|uniref:helix-turn-helix domain-containing protein n=1 Tax=Flavobacterium circumlabens TaxID=2133765 RepID=UPI001EE9A1FE|nr:helix-turn-helix domain-containing protein [Flavobacterium circumlabens]